jgi:hypothetical protein
LPEQSINLNLHESNIPFFLHPNTPIYLQPILNLWFASLAPDQGLLSYDRLSPELKKYLDRRKEKMINWSDHRTINQGGLYDSTDIYSPDQQDQAV